jgi:hypothetical protein
MFQIPGSGLFSARHIMIIFRESRLAMAQLSSKRSIHEMMFKRIAKDDKVKSDTLVQDSRVRPIAISP